MVQALMPPTPMMRWRLLVKSRYVSMLHVLLCATPADGRTISLLMSHSETCTLPFLLCLSVPVYSYVL